MIDWKKLSEADAALVATVLEKISNYIDPSLVDDAAIAEGIIWCCHGCGDLNAASSETCERCEEGRPNG